jgi:hypothetical protein
LGKATFSRAATAAAGARTATTMSMSWLARGSPCKLEAIEPLIMYSMSIGR